MDAPTPRVLFSWNPSPWRPDGTYVGTAGNSRKVTRDEALSVAGVIRGRNLICSISTLPLVTTDNDRMQVRSRLLEQIDDKTANVVTLSMTVEDLLFDSVSWWKVTAYGADGFPTKAQHIDVAAVSMFPPPGYPIHTLPSGLYPNGIIWVNGLPTHGSDMIRFDSPNPPICKHGANAIRRAIKLARAAETYADDPEARAYWTPVEGADPADDAAITAMLDTYESARRQNAEAYLPAAIKRVPIDANSPADLQLVELQRRSDLEIANLFGLDPEDLGISTTTRTYANATDRRQDRLNNVLSMYMRAITDRLSMNDITRRNHKVVFNLDDYMKADPLTRWTTHTQGLESKVLSVEEVRRIESLPAIPVESARSSALVREVSDE